MREMRRKDKQVTEFTEIVDMMERSLVCRLAMFDGDYPYIVPLNFGYDAADGRITIYLHGAKKGKKTDLLQANGNVCFEMEASHSVEINLENVYNNTVKYESVIGWGVVRMIDDLDEKNHAMQRLLQHYHDGPLPEIPNAMLTGFAVFAVDVSHLTAKRSLS